MDERRTHPDEEIYKRTGRSHNTHKCRTRAHVTVAMCTRLRNATATRHTLKEYCIRAAAVYKQKETKDRRIVQTQTEMRVSSYESKPEIPRAYIETYAEEWTAKYWLSDVECIGLDDDKI